MKTIYIHIGPPKTGSTSIQDSIFYSNKELDFLYPETGRINFTQKIEWINHEGLYRIEKVATNQHYTIWLALMGFLITPKPDDIISTLVKEIEKTEHNKILLSCESFWYLNNEQIEGFLSLFKSYKIKIIYYERELSSQIPSTYIQTIKYGYKKTFKEYYLENLDYFLSLSNQVRKWESTKYFSTIVTLNFDESVGNNSLVNDFHQAIGSQSTNSSTKTANPRLPNHISQIILFLNNLNTKFSSPVILRIISYIRNKIVWSHKTQKLLKPLSYLITTPIISNSDRCELKHLIKSKTIK
ncbi:hypothetical protein PQO01_18255 [Lentisphaera marina]|uniref:hypothetical protein n=1 Tax=Lentisphaera marina TaxID=1111041 RepID=UPI002365E5A5|nr:hypothetical protein [Lentisphaera marina]MDD7986895.1 hypothetical protein [Lentisphaera marina]